ncbi:Ldh family oxidoreductase [Geotoga petraea]|uniref:Ldh family oxidoreductase n=1 Tax=Geotoga petraea TaxID=28234 RepID=A0A4Z0VY16_9BACT|nr:Ldh family oxidoreductase [Geotoga petraea]TGG88901.1 Ldh family oxidoreductase [Geotoga petraea]
MAMVYDDVSWVDFDKLENFMTDVFKSVGVPEEDAKICANVLIAADKRGIDTHRIGRLKPIYIDRINDGIQKPVTNFEIVRETPTTAVVDGHDGMGHVIGYKSMKMAIEKAKKYGMGMVVVRNSTHYGIAGYYGLMASEQDMIGITGTNARPSVAPTWGVEPMLGTNPLTFVMPTDEEFPFFADFATPVSQRGKIEMYDRAGKEVPEGWVVGKDGKSKTNPKEILKLILAGEASLVPLGGIGEENGGYKGYDYATVVEILSAALQQGAFLKALSGFDKDGNKRPYRLGHFFIAIGINAFTEPEKFKKTTGQILRELRNSEKMPGAERIWTAGEKEYETWLERKDKGAPLNKKLREQIIELRDKYNLNYKFDFEKG